ncbi:hypothetical protein ACVISU_003410 [Bradyrhizobium sp. USDA 4452]
MTVIAVERDVARLGRIGQQRALRRADLGEATIGGTQAAAAERIVPAGVQDDDIEPRARAFHLPQHQADIDHLEIDIGLTRGVRRDRHQIIRAAHLDAMAGVIEQRHIGAHQLAAEALDRGIETGLVEVDLGLPADQRKAEPLQRAGHELCIVLRVLQPRHVLIGRIADHQRNALVGGRRLHERHCEQSGGEKGPAHRQIHDFGAPDLAETCPKIDHCNSAGNAPVIRRHTPAKYRNMVARAGVRMLSRAP